MKEFWDGFEKRANLLKTIGNITGVRHFATGSRQLERLYRKGMTGNVAPAGLSQSLQSAGQNISTGLKRMGGTALATTGTAWAGKKLMGSQQDAGLHVGVPVTNFGPGAGVYYG